MAISGRFPVQKISAKIAEKNVGFRQFLIGRQSANFTFPIESL